MNKVKEGSVIQVNEKIPEWFGCLLIVKEMKTWGVLAGMKIPFRGCTYIMISLIILVKKLLFRVLKGKL